LLRFTPGVQLVQLYASTPLSSSDPASTVTCTSTVASLATE